MDTWEQGYSDPACERNLLPEMHRSASRHLIERVGGWDILGHDRRLEDYSVLYAECRTPLQMVRNDPRHGWLSIVTPCRETEGKFAFYGRQRSRVFCCYCCLLKTVGRDLGVILPPAREWLPYMLLESYGYIHNPKAPREPGRARPGI